MASLSNWSLHDLTHRREIRRVASAFVGEIAAILHLIETHDVVAMVEQALDASGGPAALPNLTLPAFVSESPVGRRSERIRRVLTELNDALTLGDDILRELRPLLSPKHQASLTRA
jgi:hypothetical protein